MVLYVRLNEGVDSFVRIVNYLRRKEIEIKTIEMQALENLNIDLNIELGKKSSKNVINYISKLCDVKEIKLL